MTDDTGNQEEKFANAELETARLSYERKAQKTECLAARTQRLCPMTDSAAELERTQLIDLSQINRPLVAADSHPGFLRTTNEDSYGYYMSKDNRTLMLAVADGIGGHGNGDIASHLVICKLLTFWREYQQNMPSEHEKIMSDLNEAICRINREIYYLNLSVHNPVPMGTTLAMLVLTNKYAITAHLGDSRIYVVRDSQIWRLTEDHSYVNALLERGGITEEEAHHHPLAHVILRSIGAVENAIPEISTYEKMPSDRYLVCSDGLMEHLSDAQILNCMLTSANVNDAVRSLIHNTLRGGARDNVTVLSAFTL